VQPKNDEVRIFLLKTNRIYLGRGALFDSNPGPMPADFSFDRVEGMMLGLAIGETTGTTFT
jgi:ADP-ribosyl-[dinitrogen reductase] hydrolase